MLFNLTKKFNLFFILFILVCSWCLADDIHDAAKTGDLEQLKKILDENPSAVKSLDKNMDTPLHHAIDAKKISAASLLIDRGADVNAVNYNNETPLHLAAYKGNAEAVRLLLKKGADYTLREMRDRIPLFLACNWGHDLETVQLLVEAGSNVNDKNKNGEKLLVNTLSYGKREIIEYLIDKGATIPDDERTLRGVAYITASNGMERPFDIAVKKMEKQDIKWWTGIPMHACARGGSLSIAKTLIARGVSFNERNRYGIEPIHIAAENGRTGLVKFFIAKGININSASLTGKTALHFAKENGHVDLENFLISNGASQDPPKFPVLKGDYLGQERPDDTPKRFALGIVSGHGFSSEHSPAVFSPDGKELYWTEKFKGPILYMKQKNGIWTAPRKASFCSEFGDGEPIFSPDGSKLYFLSLRPLEPNGATDKENMWYTERTGDGWSEPRPVSPLINDYSLHWLFSVSSSGTIYFSSVRDGGFGANDIYSSKLINGKYTEPQNLGEVINTKGIEHTPYVAPDESYLIYVSTMGSPSMRNLKFLISYRSKDGTWREPIEFNPKVSSVGGALCPAVTPDGKYMFFVGGGDIFWVKADFIEKLRPEK